MNLHQLEIQIERHWPHAEVKVKATGRLSCGRFARYGRTLLLSKLHDIGMWYMIVLCHLVDSYIHKSTTAAASHLTHSTHHSVATK